MLTSRLQQVRGLVHRVGLAKWATGGMAGAGSRGDCLWKKLRLRRNRSAHAVVPQANLPLSTVALTRARASRCELENGYRDA